MFGKHCQICGGGVKRLLPKNFGYYWYSQECPEQFVEGRTEEEKKSSRLGTEINEHIERNT